jgi:hypothetical protein
MSGVGGWAGIGLAAGLTNPNDGLGAVGGYAGLKQYTNLGGTLTVFSLPSASSNSEGLRELWPARFHAPCRFFITKSSATMTLNHRYPIISEMNAGEIVAIGPQRSPTGIFKRATAGPWHVASDGLVGDHQGDRKNHGGPEKAIHQYPADSYATWRSEYRAIPILEQGAAFGENLCLPLMTEETVCVGDIYRIGRWCCRSARAGSRAGSST